MTRFHNVHACLVHEQPACIVDLVQNLRALDPTSTVLVYNGSANPRLLEGLGLDVLGAVVHPSPRPMKWGALHTFALDCMRWASSVGSFDALTIVDSDQLCLRRGWSERLADELARHPRIGLLGCDPRPQPRARATPPAQAAWNELELWRPFLARFGGDSATKFPTWTFWPSTVFSAAAARDLVRLFDEDEELRSILARSKLWATEEVLFPTLTALLGHEVRHNVSTYDTVKYRVPYTTRTLEAALARPDAFWMHPVPRSPNDPLRKRIRAAHNDYRGASPPDGLASDDLPLTLPLLDRMKSVEGWLEVDEADLLLSAARRALRDDPGALVEIGSHCGRATVLLGAAAREAREGARVYAIDPHDGVVGAADRRLERTRPTLETFRRNVRAAGVERWVETVVDSPERVTWRDPIAFLLIDGLHDYDNVARDFARFTPFVRPGGLVALHDYAPYYPGVVRLVDEQLASGAWRRVGLVRSMIVLERRAGAVAVIADPPHEAPEPPPAERAPIAAQSVDLGPGVQLERPRVTCIMPTKDRRAFVPDAIAYFLAQTFTSSELIIVDDGLDPIADLVPVDPRIRYVRLPARATIGAKRNLACRDARGDIIVHWDDDDWSAPWRVDYQVAAIASAEVVGLSRVLYEDPVRAAAWRYSYPVGGRPWVAGNTLCYAKSVWTRGPFADVDVGEDTRFVWGLRGLKLRALEDERFFVARMHAHNVSRKNTSDRRWARIDPSVIAEARRYRPGSEAAPARAPHEEART